MAGQGEFGDYVRGNELGFRLLGVRKIDALLSILGSGLHIVLSDVDCVWSADPLPFVLGQVGLGLGLELGLGLGVRVRVRVRVRGRFGVRS